MTEKMKLKVSKALEIEASEALVRDASKSISSMIHKGVSKIREVAVVAHAFIAPSHFTNTSKLLSEASRHKALTEAQTSKEMGLISGGKAEFHNGQLTEIISSDAKTVSESIIKSAMYNVLAREIQQNITLNQIIDKAEQIVSSLPEEVISDQEIDPDWFETFRSHAQIALKESLKETWAKVLAGEAQSPGTYSRRTFSFIQQLSSDEASLINKIAPFCFTSPGFLPAIVLSKEMFTLAELLELEALGILSGAAGILMSNWDIDSEQSEVIPMGQYVIYIKNPTDKKMVIKVPLFPLTKLGNEIVNLCGVRTDDIDYLKEVSIQIKLVASRLEVYYGNAKSQLSDMIKVSLPNPK